MIDTVRSGRRRWLSIAAVIAGAGLATGCQSATRVIAPKATFQQGGETREVEIRIEPRGAENNKAAEQQSNKEDENRIEEAAFSYSEAAFVASDNASQHRENKAETAQSNKAAKQQSNKSGSGDLTSDDLGDVIGEAVRAGSSVHVKITETRPASSYAEQGAGLSAKSDQAAMEFTTGLRGVDLPWGRAESGTAGFAGKIMGRSVNVLHILGGLTLICAVIPVVMTPRRVGLAAAIALAGVALIAAGTVAEQAPWVLVLAFVAFLAALGWLGFSAWKAGRLGLVLDRVQLGVEAAPATAGQLVKASIADAAGPAKHVVKREIAASKRRTGSDAVMKPRNGNSGKTRLAVSEDGAGQGVAPSGTEAAGGP
ncbi:MAG: hypothetical protein KJZ65_06625 [Phycisphaerales bacterium]|nr:hypothetical protein [Phycisphaerales bacterium]